MTTLEKALVDHLDGLLAYARKRLGDPDLAADALQQSLLKALVAAPDLRDEERILPWFYRVLQNTVTDIHRRHGVAARYRPALAAEWPTVVDAEEADTLCRCIQRVLPSMHADYAFLIRALELDDGDPKDVAARLGITRNHLKVKRHRARQQLRERLEATCRVCATHGCLDCSCA